MAHHCDVAPCKTAKFGRVGAPLPVFIKTLLLI